MTGPSGLETTLVTNIVAEVAGGLILIVVGYLVNFFLTRKHRLSGAWLQYIEEQKGEAEKVDLVSCSRFGTGLTGKILRIWPPEQDKKKRKEWKFEGRIEERVIILVFWSVNRRVNPHSIGTITLLRDPVQMDGRYVREDRTGMGAREHTIHLADFHLQWARDVEALRPIMGKPISQGAKDTMAKAIRRRG